MIYADNICIMGDMTIKEWKIGDKVTPIQGFGKGVPCVVMSDRGWLVPIEISVTVQTVHGATWSMHPNNLKRIEN